MMAVVYLIIVAALGLALYGQVKGTLSGTLDQLAK
jgi:hypothetical protein